MKVLALTRFSELGASSRLRFYQYIPYLRQRGIHIDPMPLHGDDYLTDLYCKNSRSFSQMLKSYSRRVLNLLTSGKYDCMWMQAEVFPWFPGLAEWVISRSRIPYIVDYDDAIFHYYDKCSSTLVRLLLGNKITSVMRRAACVVVGNSYIAEKAIEARAKRIEIIPTVVDLGRYPKEVPAKSKKNDLTIGWIGTPVSQALLKSVLPALNGA